MCIYVYIEIPKCTCISIYTRMLRVPIPAVVSPEVAEATELLEAAKSQPGAFRSPAGIPLLARLSSIRNGIYGRVHTRMLGRHSGIYTYRCMDMCIYIYIHTLCVF